MATLLGIANINFTDSLWNVADATSLNDVETTTAALTTAYQNSTAFTPGSIVVDGIAIKVASRAGGSPSNTITVRLGNAGVDVAGTVVTMNVSDIDPCTSTAQTGNEGGWYYFKFATPVTLLAATAYTVGVKLSATTTAVSLYVAATQNWARMIATTTVAAPAAGDRLAIMGDNTSAGVSHAFTVTMNNTATTSFGTTATQALTINKGGTLNWGTSAVTAYYLKIKGITRVFSGGKYQRGVSGAVMDASSTAVHEFDATSGGTDSAFEVANGATYDDWGATKVPFTILTIDKAAAATSITGLTSTSGWIATDNLIFESSTTTSNQHEKKIISTVDSSTQVTLTAGLTNAHSGTAPTQIKVGNLNRTNKFRGVSSTLTGYIFIAGAAICRVKYVEHTALGGFTSNKRGIDIQVVTGSVIYDGCTVYDCTAATAIAMNITGTNTNNYTIQNCVIYNVNTAGLINSSTSATNYLIDNNLIVASQSGGGQGCLVLGDLGGVITNNTCSSAQGGANIQISATDTPGTFSGNSAHSGQAGGVTVTATIQSGILSTITVWRNNGTGLSISASNEATFDSVVAFGNSTAGIGLSGGAGEVEINNSTLNAGVTNTQPIGLLISSSCRFRGHSNSFGATTAHATGDISITGGNIFGIFTNCLFASATEISGQTNMTESSYIGSQKHDQTSGLNKTWRKYGTIQIDTTIFDVSPSMRMTPNNAASKLKSLSFFSACASGSAVTVSVKVRESVVGDGTAYNGSRIRLMVRKNVAVGVTIDTVLATATVASSGAFELISGTTISPTEDGTLEFFVDCDGTTGWINVDTISFSPVADTKAFKYWGAGVPTIYNDNVSAGGARSMTFS